MGTIYAVKHRTSRAPWTCSHDFSLQILSTTITGGLVIQCNFTLLYEKHRLRPWAACMFLNKHLETK